MELPFVIFDNDRIDVTNFSGQAFSKSHLGEYKTEAAVKQAKEFSGFEEITTNTTLYDKDNYMTSNVMFSCYDKMVPRKFMFEKFKEQLEVDDSSVFIDIRLRIDMYQIFFVTKDNLDKYDTPEILFMDDEVAEGDCTLKQCTHVAAMSASDAIGILTNYWSNKKLGKDVFKTPFFTERNITTQSFSNINKYDSI